MAKSKRSKRMRANRRALREKLAKKDEAKRLTLLKNNQLIRKQTKKLSRCFSLLNKNNFFFLV